MEEIEQLLEKIEIGKILEDIQNNKCILFLGPLMKGEYNGKENPLVDIFSEQLMKEFDIGDAIASDKRISSYYVASKYSSFLGGRTNMESKIKPHLDIFLRGSSTIYEALAKLPFNTVINFGFDRMMQNALNKHGFEFSDNYYNYRGEQKPYIENLDDKLQLVFNLLGSVNDIDSQVLTEDDQLTFMRNIARPPGLPANVLSRIIEKKNDNKSYIFLGFNFDEWPFRFLLDILQLPKTRRSASPSPQGYNIAFTTRDFYQDKFGLNFLDLDPETFAYHLVNEYTTRYRIDRHTKGFVSYHSSDKEVFTRFKNHLDNSKLGKRIQFWSKDQKLVGDNKKKTMSEKLNEATVYIPLLSSSFLYDDQLSNEVREMLKKEDSLTFPIIVSDCDYKSEFEDILFTSKLILPGPTEDDVLVSTAQTGLPDNVFLKMIKMVNSKIR